MTTDQQAIDLQKKIRDYQKLSEKEQMGLLIDLGGYFGRVSPGKVYKPLIPSTEALLNNMYNDFREDVYLPGVRDRILDTLSIASAMGPEIEDKNRSEDFYKRVKRLGAALVSLADNMPHAKR